MPSCPACQTEVQADSRFCPECGHALSAPPAGAAQPAQRIPPAQAGKPEATSLPAEAEESAERYLPADVLARRIQPREMQGLFSKTLVIEEGYEALLLLGGRLDTTLTPGKHSMGNFLSSRTRDTTVVLFRTSDATLNTSIERVFTSDPLPLSLDLRMVLKIEQPLRLWSNLALGADSYSTRNLAAALYPLAEEGCEYFFKSRKMRDLDANQSTRQEIELALASHLEQPLSRWGLRLVSAQALGLRSEAWDEISKSRIEYAVSASREEAALEGRKRLFDVHQESDIQTMAEETLEVAGVEKRVALWERMRQALLSNAKGEIQSQAELEDVVRQADRDLLLKDDEHQSLIKAMSEAGEDHEKARAFVLRRVEAEGEHELQKLDLWHQYGLGQERLNWEISTARQEMEGRWELELRRLDLQITGQQREADFRRQQEEADQDTARSRQLENARTTAAIGDIERDQDQKDADLGMNLYNQYRAARREDEIARRQAEIDAEERRQNLTLQAESQRVELRLRESQQQHRSELERIDALSNLGIETLIAVSGAEQSQMLAQLARTRALSGCSPEQILAMQAHESPQVADALKEMLTATAASGQLEQYERLVTELKDSARMSREDYQQNMVTMNQMFNKALDSVKDTAVAFSSVPATVAAPPPPDLRSHTAPDGTVTLLFSDIEGSTAMFDRLGDLRAQEVLHIHNDIFRQRLESFDGHEVKSMGDGFMLAFSSARDGIQCSIAVQRAFAAHNQGAGEPILVRMGLHTGEAIKENQDYFGRNVILAARISAKGKGGEILVSSLVKELTESAGDIPFDEGRDVELKGLAGVTRIYPVHWEKP